MYEFGLQKLNSFIKIIKFQTLIFSCKFYYVFKEKINLIYILLSNNISYQETTGNITGDLE